MFTIAHISDLHATSVRIRSLGEIANKRALGCLSWLLRRRREHRSEVLEALVEDLAEQAPHHVAVTGDLTNLGLEGEFHEAASLLERMGGADAVSIVPGNHDAYVASPHAESWSPWARYMGARLDSDGAPGAGVEFPTVRILGPVALVGVSSARPTPPFLATGTVGPRQRERLEAILAKLADQGMCRVVLIHHPPVDCGLSKRRQLTDAPAFRDALARAGAELVLHGHGHRSSFARVAAPTGAVPVVGVPSASALGRRHPQRRAHYHIYRIRRCGESAPARFRVSCSVRRFDPAKRRFTPCGERSL